MPSGMPQMIDAHESVPALEQGPAAEAAAPSAGIRGIAKAMP
jgi:hypothetical protein